MEQLPNQFVKTPDGSIYLEVHGSPEGVPLIVLNGGPGFDHSYLKVSGAWLSLSATRPVVFYDQRGTGKSFPLKEGVSCTFVDQISDLEEIRSHLNLNQMDLLGHSWGGFLAMAYVARHPSFVRRLILVNSGAPKLQDNVFLFEDVYPEAVKRQKAEEFGMEMGDEEAIKAYITEYLSMLFVSNEKKDQFIAQADPKWYIHKVNQKLWSDADKFDLTPELSKFAQQTLVISGRFDMNVATSVAYKIHKEITNSTFKVFEQSGHMPFFEEEEAFVQTVDGFLSQD